MIIIKKNIRILPASCCSQQRLDMCWLCRVRNIVKISWKPVHPISEMLLTYTDPEREKICIQGLNATKMIQIVPF